MNCIAFVSDVGSFTPWDRETLAGTVMDQGRAQGLVVDAEIRGIEMTVEIRGGDSGRMMAFEAAIKCWLNKGEQ